MTHRPHTRPEIAADRVRALMSHDPPNAENAERGLLSCVLQSPECLLAAQDLIASPEVFAKPAHIVIWEAVTKIANSGGAIHLTAIEAALSGRGMLDQAGGVDYLIDVIETEARPNVATVQTMAQAVIAMHAKRKILELGHRMIIDGHESDEDATSLLDAIQTEAVKIGDAMQGTSSITGMASLADVLDPDAEQTQGTHIATGYYDLDRMMNGGPLTGMMTVIGARPSMGKSAMMVGLVDQIASSGVPVGVFSLEMPKSQLGLRLLSRRSRVESKIIKDADYAVGSMAELNVQDARNELRTLPVHIDDMPGITLQQLRSRIRRMISEFGTKVVFIDFLQRIQGDPKLPREQQISLMSRTIADMGREFDVLPIVLCQINRQNEQRADKRPMMSDLRESGAIEQDARNILLLHRPAYYEKDVSEPYDPIVEVIIAKQSEGPTGTVRLHFDKVTASMENAAREDQQEQGGLY